MSQPSLGETFKLTLASLTLIGAVHLSTQKSDAVEVINQAYQAHENHIEHLAPEERSLAEAAMGVGL